MIFASIHLQSLFLGILAASMVFVLLSHLGLRLKSGLTGPKEKKGNTTSIQMSTFKCKRPDDCCCEMGWTECRDDENFPTTFERSRTHKDGSACCRVFYHVACDKCEYPISEARFKDWSEYNEWWGYNS